jgi:hypothetical protein
MAPKRYIEKMIASYVSLFGMKQNTKYHSPLKKGDHPELDESEFIDAKQTKFTNQ